MKKNCIQRCHFWPKSYLHIAGLILEVIQTINDLWIFFKCNLWYCIHWKTYLLSVPISYCLPNKSWQLAFHCPLPGLLKPMLNINFFLVAFPASHIFSLWDANFYFAIPWKTGIRKFKAKDWLPNLIEQTIIDLTGNRIRLTACRGCCLWIIYKLDKNYL